MVVLLGMMGRIEGKLTADAGIGAVNMFVAESLLCWGSNTGILFRGGGGAGGAVGVMAVGNANID